MNRKSADDELAPITADDMARFRRNAPAALARRGAAFVGESLGNALSLLLTGLIPIVGMLYFQWSASEMLVFLIVGAWIGIVCDVAKFLLLPAQVKRFGDVYYDDWHVWVVANALRRGLDQAPKSHLAARYEPALGVFVDFVCGGIGTALLRVALAEGGFNFRSDFWQNPALLKGLALLAIYEAAMTIWEMVSHKVRGDAAGELSVALGMRGLGLFLLLFLVVMIHDALGDNGAVARNAMLAVNAAILLAAAFNLVGIFWLRAETNWLSDYLRTKGVCERS